jgi:hypothetical protein
VARRVSAAWGLTRSGAGRSRAQPGAGRRAHSFSSNRILLRAMAKPLATAGEGAHLDVGNDVCSHRDRVLFSANVQSIDAILQGNETLVVFSEYDHLSML